MKTGKIQTVFFCKNCGYESSKWMGQCPSCREWNTFVEEPVLKTGSKASLADKACAKPRKPVHIDEIGSEESERIPTGFEELDRVLGGGIVEGSLVLVGGEPGIGKSTILLQLAANLASSGKKVMYISGEESLRQIKLRADRVGKIEGELGFLSETNIENIVAVLEEQDPDVAVIDSIQTMYTDEAGTAPGSITQVRESASRLMMTAKTSKTAIFLVGHVTKEGTVAGPRVLEHMVDTVLYFEGGEEGSYRIIRSAKNRFGSTNEIGVFEMCSDGLKEVMNPSELLLKGRPEDASGAVVACLMEGTRPILMEVQALVTETGFGMPRRQASGIDYNRLNLLLAVLEKRAGFAMSRLDAYVNVTGGMRVTEPATDLAVIMAVISSLRNTVIPSDTIIFGEVGLSGEVRGVAHADLRVREARKLGFKRVILPKTNMQKICGLEGIELIPVRNIQEAASCI